MGQDFVPVLKGDAKHGSGKHLRHVTSQFDWLFFRHKNIEPSNVATGGLKINLFCAKKQVDNCGLFVKVPPTMRNDTLNGILTFVLGVLVVLGVIFALRVVNIMHETRVLGSAAVQANGNMARAQGLLNEAVAYNKKYPNPQLTSILESLQTRPVNR
jgi:hypothetical protein